MYSLREVNFRQVKKGRHYFTYRDEALWQMHFIAVLDKCRVSKRVCKVKGRNIYAVEIFFVI